MMRVELVNHGGEDKFEITLSEHLGTYVFPIEDARKLARGIDELLIDNGYGSIYKEIAQDLIEMFDKLDLGKYSKPEGHCPGGFRRARGVLKGATDEECGRNDGI